MRFVSVFVRIVVGGMCLGVSPGVAMAQGRSTADEQADWQSGSGRVAAYERVADVDGGEPGWAVGGNGGRGVWDVGVGVPAVLVGGGCADGCGDGLAGRADVCRGEADVYSGLAFSGDGRHLYGSVGSISDPEGKAAGNTGSGVVVYGFAEGKLTRERVTKIPLQTLAAGRKTKLIGDTEGGVGVPFPAGVAVVPGEVGARQRKAGPSTSLRSGRDDRSKDGEQRAERLLVADNLSDDVLLMMRGQGRW